MSVLTWQKADRAAMTITWEDAVIAFVCPCGEEIVLEDEAKTCDCGRVWRYVVQLQVQEDERG